MTTTTIDPQVAAYLAAVRAELADLPDDERDEVLEDLESHLVEVAAESDEPLAVRLGPPADYAADLRSSAGLAPASGSAARARRAHRRWARLNAHPTVQRVRGFLPELRPGWWVLRGILAVWVFSMTSDVDASDIPFPPVFGSRFVGLLAMVAAVPLSVRLGRRQQTDARLARTVHLGEAALLVLTLPLLASLHDDGRTDYVDYYGPVTTTYGVYGGALVGPDGQPITNFYATDADGQPIEHFRLYDQNGMPVTNVAEIDDFSNPEGTVRSQVPIDLDGRPVPNGYPRDTWLERYDGTTESLTPPVDASTTTAAPTTAPPTTPTTEPPAPETTVAPPLPG
jgi:hypothetical protein